MWVLTPLPVVFPREARLAVHTPEPPRDAPGQHPGEQRRGRPSRWGLLAATGVWGDMAGGGDADVGLSWELRSRGRNSLLVQRQDARVGAPGAWPRMPTLCVLLEGQGPSAFSP